MKLENLNFFREFQNDLLFIRNLLHHSLILISIKKKNHLILLNFNNVIFLIKIC